MTATVKMPVPGDVITYQGHTYVVGQPLGAGYFGTVFECTDDWGNNLVAKVLRPKDQTREQVEQNWQRELKNLITLRHPHITFVHNAFECEGVFYLMLERCSWSFDRLIGRPNIHGELWVEPVARCVLQAIHFMHRAGYIHKDIHPGNVLASEARDEMNPNQQPTVQFKVGDLGISRLLPEVDVFNTLVAQWMVPPEFLNPEEFGKVSWNVDIYHCGLLLLSLVSGRIPTFTADDVLNGRPREMAEKLDSAYSQPIAEALRRHVDARTPTALEFWRQIKAAGSNIDWSRYQKPPSEA